MATESTSITLHASSVSLDGKALLILGDSGSGKSSLALQLLGLGADLIVDDRTTLQVVNGALHAQCPAPIKGLIEARGVGILRLPPAPPAPITLIVDLNKHEESRLPHPHSATFLGITVGCLWNAPSSHFASAVLLCLRYGISDKT